MGYNSHIITESLLIFSNIRVFYIILLNFYCFLGLDFSRILQNYGYLLNPGSLSDNYLSKI